MTPLRGANARYAFNSVLGWPWRFRGGGENVMGVRGVEGWGLMGRGWEAALVPLRWMKAPRPAVVAVTNLLRFSAQLEARGRGPPWTLLKP